MLYSRMIFCCLMCNRFTYYLTGCRTYPKIICSCVQWLYFYWLVLSPSVLPLCHYSRRRIKNIASTVGILLSEDTSITLLWGMWECENPVYLGAIDSCPGISHMVKFQNLLLSYLTVYVIIPLYPWQLSVSNFTIWWNSRPWFIIPLSMINDFLNIFTGISSP